MKPGTLGLRDGRKLRSVHISEYIIGYNRPHPLYSPQFLQDQHIIETISSPVAQKLGHKLLYEGGKKKKRGGKGGKRRGEEKRLIFAMDNDVFPLNFVKQKYYRT